MHYALCIMRFVPAVYLTGFLFTVPSNRENTRRHTIGRNRLICTVNKNNMSSQARVQYKITPGALVCNEAELIGDVSIGVRTVVHPKARIVAENGPIIIGDGNLIEEQCLIINKSGKPMTIGHNNVFEIGSNIEAASIGDNNVFEAKTLLGPHIEITNGCVIGAMCKLTGSERLPENTVIFGQNCERRRAAERPAPQMLQLDFLTKILPNYHHMKGRGK